MTSLRFVGDLPVWLGLVLSLLVCGLSWRYYSRESFDLPRRLKWLLPLLRSLAFFLGIMVLTGPVLHHRKVIGELGRVKLFLDGSRSMTMHDRHMSPGRKLLIAEQLGWLSPDRVDAGLLKQAEQFGDIRQAFEEQWAASDVTKTATLKEPIETLRRQVEEFAAGLPADVSEHMAESVLKPIETLLPVLETDAGAAKTSIDELVKNLVAVEALLQKAFDDSIESLLKSDDESVRAAIAMFDETPRWQRTESALQAALQTASGSVLAQLREQHDVEVYRLEGSQAVLIPGGFGSSETAESAAAGAEQSGQMVAGVTAEGEGATDSGGTSGDAGFSNVTDLSSGVVASQKAVTASGDPVGTGATSPEGGDSGLANNQGIDIPRSPNERAAIVMLTDGQHNRGASPLQTARVLGSQGVAFYNVSVGASQQASDLAVMDIEHPDLVFQKDKVRGVMIIRDQMPAGQSFVAQIKAGEETLWQQQLVSQNSGERRVEFEFPIDDLVTRMGAQLASDIELHSIPLSLEASLAPLADETETSNNQRTMRLAAIVQSYRLLIIDGRSRWETRYLRNAFERDEQWSVNTIIAGPGTDDAVLRRGDQEGAFPATREALFKYDLIIYGDVSSELFTPADLEWMQQFVELRGGGLIFIDGQRGLLRQLADKSLGSLLPIEWLPEAIGAKPAALSLTDKGASESALVLAADDQQNRRFWNELPPPHAMVSVNALPGSEVLVEASVGGKTLPAMVTRVFGAGRVLYMASDETWRWRYKAADTWHQRIWNQLARFVMPRPFSVSDEYVSIDTGAVRYDFGDSVDVRVRLLGLDGKPALNATADAIVWKDGRVISTVSLNADPDIEGIYRGRFGSLPEGDYEVSVRAAGYSEAALKARSRFVVQPPESGEMTQTAANESLLRQMAAASSGAWLREEEISRLPELLAPLSNGRVVESDTLIWQSYWWFAAIVMLLTVEWVLRKRAGLL